MFEENKLNIHKKHLMLFYLHKKLISLTLLKLLTSIFVPIYANYKTMRTIINKE